MKRSTATLLILGLAIGYGAAIVLGAAVLQQRSELASIEARLAPSPGAQPSPNSVASPVGVAPASPSASSSGLPQILKVTSADGFSWNGRYAMYVLGAKRGTDYILTASAADPLNRPLEWMFVQTHPNEYQKLICGWGGPTCTYTVQGTPGMITSVGVAVRDNETTHALAPGQCTRVSSAVIDAQTDSCDDEWEITFDIAA